ncbi:MAG: hypothetical protein ATN31_05260 [Candidatus Epulonipiscioides saccharophilum]|nr:MAG: hypothetical protein ATN31_05260 [Epulopiscium sp. AS2M-Bin001]
MFIRSLSFNDGDILKNIRYKALKNNPEAFGASYEEEQNYDTLTYSNRLKDENNYFFGAFENNEIIGLICLSKNTRLKTSHRSTITSFYVDLNYRRMGIGKQLLSTVLQKAADIQMIEQVELSVVSIQYPAISLYISMGFEIYGTEFHSLKID